MAEDLMENYVSLSGETPAPDLVASFAGVGMIRAEYIMRHSEEYITLPSCQERLGRYVESVAKAFYPKPVWLRMADLTTVEVNTLKGADAILVENDIFKGLRGLRRALAYPVTFRQEIDSVLDVARRYSNLHYMFCYVTDAEEFAIGHKLLRSFGWPNQVGSMLEIPSAVQEAKFFIAEGATNLTVGTNDLTSLLTGRQRTSERGLEPHQSLWRTIEPIMSQVTPGIDFCMAGYLTREVRMNAASHGFSHLTVHYANIPDVFGGTGLDLSDLAHMQTVKDLTRKRVREWREKQYSGQATSA